MSELFLLEGLVDDLHDIEAEIRVHAQPANLLSNAPVGIEFVVPSDGSQRMSNQAKLSKHVGIALVSSGGALEALHILCRDRPPAVVIVQHAALTRSLFEIWGRLTWLLDPSIDAKERWLRNIQLMFASLKYRVAIDTPFEISAEKQRLRADAVDLGLLAASNDPIPEPVSLGKSVRYLFDSTPFEGDRIYKELSSATHGMVSTLADLAAKREKQSLDYLSPTDDELATYHDWIAAAHEVVVGRVRIHYGLVK